MLPFNFTLGVLNQKNIKRILQFFMENNSDTDLKKTLMFYGSYVKKEF